MTSQASDANFRRGSADEFFARITSTDEELQKKFDEYLLDEYEGDLSERLNYLGVAEIARFLVEKIETGQARFFNDFFNEIEFILLSCDKYIEDLIVEGLFEAIQNFGKDIDYYHYFDKWLKPLSKQKWDNLIDSWEGKDWRRDGNGSKMS